MERCYCKTNAAYPRYGGRGIVVCDEWHDFTKFYADMGDRPAGRSLDRRDNDGPYSPENCRWATRTEQARNTRVNTILEFRGRKQCLQAWAEELGLKPATICRRMYVAGWSVDKALSTAVQR